MRRFTLVLIFILMVQPIMAQQGEERRTKSNPDIYARMINYIDTEIRSLSINGEEEYTGISAFGWTTGFMLLPGRNTITAQTATGDTLEVEIIARAGEVYEIISFDNRGQVDLRAFEYGELLGSPVDLSRESPWMRMNLFDDIRAIDIYYDGELVINDLEYGEAGAGRAPLAFFQLTVTNADTGETLAEYDRGYGEPYYVSVTIFDGSFSGEWFEDGYDYLYADPITYLSELTRYEIRDTYTVYLRLVEAAGMTEELRNLDDVQLFVPDDAALLSLGSNLSYDDPVVLRRFIEGYIVPDFWVSSVQEGETVVMQSLAGTNITINNTDGNITVNNAPLYYNYAVFSANGRLNLGILDGVTIPR